MAFWLHVTPRARRQGIGGLHGDALRLAVAEAPVGGAANAACVRAVAEAFGVGREAVVLDPRSRGRRKRIRIRGESGRLEQRLMDLAAERH